MINIVIFSKDRAMQLELCLRSLKKHFKEIEHAKKTVIFAASDEDFENGYSNLEELYPDFSFVRQTRFEVDTHNAIDHDQDYTMFLVDDIIFKDDFSLTDDAFKMLRNNDQMLALSLRLHPGATYCYALDQNMRPPKAVRHVRNQFMVWRYRGCEGDWGYGLSVDGNIYNTKFIVPVLNRIHFTNPNELEANLNNPAVTQGIMPLFMCCYDGISKLLNVPANRVQDKFANRNEMSYTAKELNDRFLNGERISLNGITGINNFSVHYPIDYEFEK